MRFIALEKAHRLVDGYRSVVSVEGRNLLLFQEDNQIHIVDNHCPHAGAKLDKATIENGVLRCPWHGICFDVQTGNGLVHDMQLIKFPVCHQGADIGILLD
jgi:3-phenylpropionate/trans-cinnamate dioxygenase ferredoxin subunit